MEIHHMIKSPKEKFQSSQIRTGQWGNIVTSPIFDEACDVALLQMQENVSAGYVTQFAADAYQQIQGALQVVRILKTLHETTQEPKKTEQKGLNYQAGV